MVLEVCAEGEQLPKKLNLAQHCRERVQVVTVECFNRAPRIRVFGDATVGILAHNLPVSFDQEGAAATRRVKNIGGVRQLEPVEDIPRNRGRRVILALFLALFAIEKPVVDPGHEIAAGRREIKARHPEQRPFDGSAQVHVGQRDDPVHFRFIERRRIKMPARPVSFLQKPCVAKFEIFPHALKCGDAAVAEIAARARPIRRLDIEKAVIFEEPDQENARENKIGRFVGEEALGFLKLSFQVEAGAFGEARDRIECESG